jgi:hypothetical protein
MTLSNYEKHQQEFEREFNKHEQKDFTSLENELWWFVRNCSEENFHEPLEDTTKLTKELLKIIKKWNS